MRKISLFTLFLMVAHVVIAQTKVVSSAVTYEIKNLGINTHGKFGAIKADVNFTPQNLKSSTITASIDATTVDSDNKTRDSHLKGEKFFDVEKYPEISMKSISFKSKGGDKYEGEFNLTIKGKTKKIKLPFTYTVNQNAAQYRGSFTINRKDFNVGGSSMTLADEATITLALDTEK